MGGLDESLLAAADKDYCWKVQQSGFPLHFIPDAIIQYRLRHTPNTAYRQAKTWGRDHPLIYARYGIPIQKRIILHHLLGLAAYMPKGIKLWLMSTFRIRRGRGGFVGWAWGLSFVIGEIQRFLEHPHLQFVRK